MGLLIFVLLDMQLLHVNRSIDMMLKTSTPTFRYFLFCSLLFLFSCSDDEVIIDPAIDNPSLTEFQQETINYFADVALGFEFGGASLITRKWKENVLIDVSGDMPDYLLQELDDIIAELNDLITDGVTLSIVEQGQAANLSIFFGSGTAYAEVNPSALQYVNNNRGLFFVNWDGTQNLNWADMYVDTERVEEVFQRHLLREELTQSLGLAMDRPEYPESIFQTSWTSTTEYADIDKELIRLLYHPDVVSGLNELQVREMLEEILANE